MANYRIAIVGGIPDPIGGVTTFIRRVIRREKCVSHLFDLYPATSKRVPSEFSGKYICESKKPLTLIKLFFFLLKGEADFIHFNFSTPKALILLLLLPKIKSKWLLTLHHGNLGDDVAPWMRWVLSKKVDTALSLNERQAKWYSRSIASEKINASSSYVPPSTPHPTPDFAAELTELKSKYRKIFVCSGFPTKIYNHLLTIDLMKSFPEDLLICCLYGPGDLRTQIKEQASETRNVVVFESLDEDDFNFLLSNSDLYLRLNTEDSFGIAVADSLNLGSKCISTDVCPRYQGAALIPRPKEEKELTEYVKSFLSQETNLPKSKNKINDFSYSRL